MTAMAVCFSKPNSVLLRETALCPQNGIVVKGASLMLLLSSSRRMEVRASVAKGAKLVTLVGKGGAGKTTAAVLAAQVPPWILPQLQPVVLEFEL